MPAMNATQRPIILFVVQSDPRTSHRPAEAIRIAAGIGTWRKADVRLCLLGPAVRAVGEWVDDLVDEDNFTRYLPILRDLGHPVLVEAGAIAAADLGEASVPYEPLGPDDLAAWCARAGSVLRF
jgi:hypothetical protein